MKTKFYQIAFLALFTLFCVSAQAANTETKEAMKARVSMMTQEKKEERAKEIRLRVEEIRHMDKSALNSSERKELRMEMKSMRDEARALGSGGVYISLAGIIIIILLLIIIL